MYINLKIYYALIIFSFLFFLTHTYTHAHTHTHTHTHANTHTVYRCSNCHELTVACTTCKDATRLKTSLASSTAATGCYTHTHTHKSTHTQDSTKAWAWECASLSPRIGEHGGGGGGEMVIVNGKRCVACLSSKMWSQLDREVCFICATGRFTSGT